MGHQAVDDLGIYFFGLCHAVSFVSVAQGDNALLPLAVAQKNIHALAAAEQMLAHRVDEGMSGYLFLGGFQQGREQVVDPCAERHLPIMVDGVQIGLHHRQACG